MLLQCLLLSNSLCNYSVSLTP